MLTQTKLRDWKNPQAGLNYLNDHLGIKVREHEDGRVILNYDQIKSPKTDPIVRECRGLVLDKNNDWNLVARSFERFFNLGEHLEEQNNFVWEDCIATDKADGSLAIVYFWNGDWHFNTRGSFGDGLVNDSPLTWHKLLDLAMPDDWRKKLDPSLTYIGELCSPYNKVVTHYDKPDFYLLSAFQGADELSHEDARKHGTSLGLSVCRDYRFDGADAVVEFVRMQSANDPTYEGVVLRSNGRIKVKSAKYVELHRLHNNGNIFSAKSLVPLVMDGEADEILVYYPELKPHIERVQEKLRAAFREIDDLWFCHHDEKNQKKFAMAVKDCPFASILFEARKLGVHPIDIWRKSADLIIKKVDFGPE